MPRHADRSPPPPLDAAAIERLALGYVGRYATTRAKLAAYLARKVRERGWAGADPFDAAPTVARVAALGYVDDAGFAASRARTLAARGYGARRVELALRVAGIDEEDRRAAVDGDDEAAYAAALAFAKRRRIGPFARTAADHDERRKQFAALLRAGHSGAIARRLLDARRAELPDPDAD